MNLNSDICMQECGRWLFLIHWNMTCYCTERCLFLGNSTPQNQYVGWAWLTRGLFHFYLNDFHSPAEFTNNPEYLLNSQWSWSWVLFLPSHPALKPRVLCWSPVGCFSSIADNKNRSFQYNMRSAGYTKTLFWFAINCKYLLTVYLWG